MGATLIGHRRSADVEEPRSDIAVAAVLDQLDRVLLVRQNYGRGWWALPGGEVDAGEQPADAAVREVEEETDFGSCSNGWSVATRSFGRPAVQS